MSGANRYSGKKNETIQSESVIMTEGLRSRRARPSSIQAAMELKAKRATTQVILNKSPFQVPVNYGQVHDIRSQLLLSVNCILNATLLLISFTFLVYRAAKVQAPNSLQMFQQCDMIWSVYSI